MSKFWQKAIISFCFLCSFSVHALIEVSGNFSYKKQVYGEHRQNSLVEREYSGAMTFYLFQYTGVEFNYSEEEDISTEKEEVTDGSSVVTLTSQSKIRIKTYGVGIRQAFANPRSFFVPAIAIGYAHQEKTGGVSYIIDESGTSRDFYYPYQKQKGDAVFGMLSLSMKLTTMISINGSVKTVFDAFEWNKAKDDLKYQVGFSWYI